MMKFGLNFIGKGYNLHVNKMMDFPFYSFWKQLNKFVFRDLCEENYRVQRIVRRIVMHWMQEERMVW